ncbi:VOC family protein [Xenorhabdus szentirmaii]|uniref:Metallothiol transferase fosB (Fosfomycin resistance protein) n=1 Tax=Xenorhabdus szentirmaii DSM 16338 TaxID=1427518 RepID=W1IVJ7_9GAMM|nr:MULTISPECIES: VOC family protein [Xenorhabdus]MBD2791941.1 VOC family protein [Xenorhabdus sp. CUL]MBD2820740.1 VOC family protein [Xenorhabdus sp. 42]MBD2823611.1 VOC family protein [Xenorhabdus sp. 5]PHM32855.1 FosB [Xenorhabdus szentirmaii DSM 16338]PHM40826.1 FosB [Xenorhabdus szentirmaii]
MNSITPINVTRFDHIQMEVANLDESIRFYEEIFGFKKKEAGLRRMVRWVILGNESKLYLCLHEYTDRAGIENAGLEITHVGFIVDDFDSVLHKLKYHNVKLPDGDITQYHSSRSIYFLDPNGYKVEISEFNGGGIDP